jgi:hypothetical protein
MTDPAAKDPFSDIKEWYTERKHDAVIRAFAEWITILMFKKGEAPCPFCGHVPTAEERAAATPKEREPEEEPEL